MVMNVDKVVAARVADVRRRMAAAAERSGRPPEAVTLLAAVKYASADLIEATIRAGIRDLGENKAQEAAQRYARYGDRVLWHFIGHLQRNKVRRVVPFATLIHSVDGLGLAEEIEKRASRLGKRQDVLVEVKTSPEETKFGVKPEALGELLDRVGLLPHVRVTGLMTIAPLVSSENVRPYFRLLRELAGEYRTPQHPLEVLSMGMTNDYEVAIEEGATMVRVGSAFYREGVG